jgi:hypothetical protein
MAGRFDSDIGEIDAYLADAKTLDGGEPLWIKSARRGELQATWGILDSAGVSRGELRFRVSPTERTEPSITVIHRRRLIWRLDVVAANSWKPNPQDAWVYRLPAIVRGTHNHAWPDNREHVRANGFGEMPYRRPLGAATRRLPQALAALAAEINLVLGPNQRGFDVPAKSDLFD